MVVDYRRELVEAVPEEYRLGHAVSVDQLRELVDGAARALKTRMPGADISPARMRLARLVEGPAAVHPGRRLRPGRRSPMTTPFQPLIEHLPLGYEVGFHLVVARAAAGAMRGVNDPLIRRLMEANTPGLLMSCPPSEGYIFGNVKPRILPPGRGLYITRRSTLQMQTALVEDRVPDAV